MLDILTRKVVAVALRGILAIVFGIVALVFRALRGSLALCSARTPLSVACSP